MKSDDRRRLLLWSAAAAVAATGAPWRAAQAVQSAGSGLLKWPRQLWITRPEAQESVRVTYWADGRCSRTATGPSIGSIATCTPAWSGRSRCLCWI
jgi:hypothetical protein